MNTTHQGEVQFVAYTDSSSGGPCIKFRLPDREELQSFVGKEGKRFMLALVEIGDDEQPVQPQKLGPLALLAVQWCKDKEFQHWMGISSEAKCAEHIKRTCGVDSRKELDSDPVAAHIFQTRFRKPYMALQEQQAERVISAEVR